MREGILKRYSFLQAEGEEERVVLWYRFAMVISAPQFHSIRSTIRFSAGSNLARGGVSKVCNGKPPPSR